MTKTTKTRAIFLGGFLVLLAAEILIALFVRDRFIRPYGGDVLAVIALWCLVRCIYPKPNKLIWIFVLGFAFLLELSQYIGLAEAAGVRSDSVIGILLGSSFSWVDMICYAVGAVPCAIYDLKSKKYK